MNISLKTLLAGAIITSALLTSGIVNSDCLQRYNRLVKNISDEAEKCPTTNIIYTNCTANGYCNCKLWWNPTAHGLSDDTLKKDKGAVTPSLVQNDKCTRCGHAAEEHNKEVDWFL